MYIDELEILDAVITRLLQEFYDRSTKVKLTSFHIEISRKQPIKGLL